MKEPLSTDDSNEPLTDVTPESSAPASTAPAEAVPDAEVPLPGSKAEAAAQGPSLEAQLATAKAETAAAQERHLRAIADLENFRKRAVREKEDLRLFAAGRVIEELLPVMDNLGLGLAAAKAPQADLQTLIGGIEMVGNQLKSALANHGLTEINPVGQAFDPNLHEAIAQQPSAEVAEGAVLNVVRTGYSLNGRLLRPASVVVSGGPEKPAEQPA
jgi:molecular chaperone GrpE